jgi:hypothetical protein
VSGLYSVYSGLTKLLWLRLAPLVPLVTIIRAITIVTMISRLRVGIRKLLSVREFGVMTHKVGEDLLNAEITLVISQVFSPHSSFVVGEFLSEPVNITRVFYLPGHASPGRFLDKR